jgi:hypothetical protein
MATSNYVKPNRLFKTQTSWRSTLAQSGAESQNRDHDRKRNRA